MGSRMPYSLYNCYSHPSSGAQAVNLLVLLLFNCLDNAAGLLRVGKGAVWVIAASFNKNCNNDPGDVAKTALQLEVTLAFKDFS